jgi:predicted component of type VI protein secretion system
MKRLLICLALSAALTACAAAPQKSASGVKLDVQKVASINTWAETKGARVLWVHYPTHAAGQKDE